ncbi:zona pellucida sperm-binding protein 1-like [Triplophysa rosa]|uniref:zona pellucida sperm-binding protein 1-like n=1 Tax=Triplophysa rosa TaxID=992332 RepID=UPI002545DE60|nr:zona pellucida sperm-binding protein 1-like [Triplophysa rosa]
MAAQRENALVILALCCVELGFSQSLNYYSGIDDDYSVEAEVQVDEAPQETSEVLTSKLPIYCNNETIKVILPSGLLSKVTILGFSVIESVVEAPESCGYCLTQGSDHNILLVDYTGCHVTLKDGWYSLTILYPNEDGLLDVATLSCEASPKSSLQSDQMSKCAKLPPGPAPRSPQHAPAQPAPAQSAPPQQILLPLNIKPGGCSICADQRVTCSTYHQITSDECLAKGCCFDAMTSVCYYPMDECTADKNFVFAVHADFANIPVNPMSLMVAGKTGCKPVISNEDFAIFKFSVTECGAHSFVIGDTTIYLVEVHTIVRARNLKYGMISRDNPIRLIVECRYPKVSATPVLASAGYMVMSPSLPLHLLSKGLFGVQLLISEDETFTKFYSQHHQPLSVLLGKPVYLELRLNSPKPQATLVVHYCVAYPRSDKSALVLVFEGCPYPLDSGNTAILYMKDLLQNRHQRRFEIKAFQFMDLPTNKYLNEEIYFMCSTEVCMPSGSPCVEACFDGKSP